ncbi:MAG: hypothetical protein WC262_12315 [Bacteroidales bacterium]|jgi:hypothetical protein
MDGWVYINGFTGKRPPGANGRYSEVSVDYSQSPARDSLGTVAFFDQAQKDLDKLLPDHADRVEIWDRVLGYLIAYKEI